MSCHKPNCDRPNYYKSILCFKHLTEARKKK